MVLLLILGIVVLIVVSTYEGAIDISSGLSPTPPILQEATLAPAAKEPEFIIEPIKTEQGYINELGQFIPPAAEVSVSTFSID